MKKEIIIAEGFVELIYEDSRLAPGNRKFVGHQLDCPRCGADAGFVKQSELVECPECQLLIRWKDPFLELEGEPKEKDG